MPYDPRNPEDVPEHMRQRPREEQRACTAAFNSTWERLTRRGVEAAEKERASMIACNVAANRVKEGAQ